MNRRITAALRLMAALGAIAAPALAAQVLATQSAGAQTVTDPYAWSGPQPRGARPAQGQPQPFGGLQTYDRQSYNRQAYDSQGGPQTYDRYGGGTVHPTVYAPAPAAAYGPLLSWAGKVDAPGQPAMAAPVYGAPAYGAPAFGAPSSAAPTYAAPAYAPAAYGAPSYPVPAYAPPAGAPSAYAPPPPAASLAQAAPRSASVYDPPDAPPATNVSTARRYSVHREYGMAPDPIPLAPQFFGPTADLTQPETPEPQRRVVGADGKARNPVQPAESP